MAQRVPKALNMDELEWLRDACQTRLEPVVVEFWAGRAERPTWKKKGRHDRLTLTNDQFTITGRKVHIPKLGWVRMHEPLRYIGKVLEATVSRTADRWFLSVRRRFETNI